METFVHQWAPCIDSPGLICVGDHDAVMPVDASKELAAALRPGIGRLEVIAGAGHFPWLDQPAEFWRLIGDFVTEVYGVAIS